MAMFLILLLVALLVIAFGFMTISYELERRAYQKDAEYDESCCLG